MHACLPLTRKSSEKMNQSIVTPCLPPHAAGQLQHAPKRPNRNRQSNRRSAGEGRSLGHQRHRRVDVRRCNQGGTRGRRPPRKRGSPTPGKCLRFVLDMATVRVVNHSAFGTTICRTIYSTFRLIAKEKLSPFERACANLQLHAVRGAVEYRIDVSFEKYTLSFG